MSPNARGEPAGFRITRILTAYAQKLPGHWSLSLSPSLRNQRVEYYIYKFIEIMGSVIV